MYLFVYLQQAESPPHHLTRYQNVPIFNLKIFSPSNLLFLMVSGADISSVKAAECICILSLHLYIVASFGLTLHFLCRIQMAYNAQGIHRKQWIHVLKSCFQDILNILMTLLMVSSCLPCQNNESLQPMVSLATL